MTINIKKLSDTAKIPTRADSGSAGYDLYSDINEEIVLRPHSTTKIPTGLAMEIPEGYFGGIYARSGMATKRNCRPANCVGIVDSSFRGNVTVALHNDSNMVQIVEPHERVAQLVIQPYLNVDFNETDILSETERGEGGFGHSGSK